ncbi:MAG: hypothetical protein WAM11_09380 [Cyanobium sp.]
MLISAIGGAKALAILRSTTLAALLAAVAGQPALAVEASRCRALRQQRDDLASQAMATELTLVRQVREKICPRLTRLAEQANANQPPPTAGVEEPAPDYRALIHCRQQTEQVLKASHPVLYRNRLGFTYYTRSGADLASQSDAVQRQLLTEACPAWLRGEPEPTGTVPR